MSKMLGEVQASGNYGYENQLSRVNQADSSTSHKIDMLCLAILVRYR
jgi:hypothetical protein